MECPSSVLVAPFHCLLASSVDSEKCSTQYFVDNLHVSFSSRYSGFSASLDCSEISQACAKVQNLFIFILVLNFFFCSLFDYMLPSLLGVLSSWNSHWFNVDSPRLNLFLS